MYRSIPKRCYSAKTLQGSVTFYTHHVAILTNQSSWPSKIEGVKKPDISAFSSILHRLTDFKPTIKLTASQYPPRLHSKSHSGKDTTFDFVLFPNGYYFKNVDLSRLLDILEPISTLANTIDGKSIPIPHLHDRTQDVVSKIISDNNEIVVEKLTGDHIVVCTHAERDCRCGEKGGQIYQTLLKSVNQSDDFWIWNSSHIGGHAFAGNIITYPSGDWYGYLEGSDALDIIKAVKGQDKDILSSHWRGRIGLLKADQQAEVRQKEKLGNWEGENAKKQFINIHFQTHNSSRVKVTGEVGQTLMQTAKANNIDIEAACGGNLECATCHVIIPTEDQLRYDVPPPSEEEEDMLEYAVNPQPGSRLSCQIKLKQNMDKMLIAIPSL